MATAVIRADMKRLSEDGKLSSILKCSDEKTTIDFNALRDLGYVVRGNVVVSDQFVYADV